MKSLWEYISIGLGIYTIYNKVQEAKKLENDIYMNLSPEHRAQWDKILGVPASMTLQVPTPTLTTTQVSHLTQIKAGT